MLHDLCTQPERQMPELTLGYTARPAMEYTEVYSPYSRQHKEGPKAIKGFSKLRDISWIRLQAISRFTSEGIKLRWTFNPTQKYPENPDPSGIRGAKGNHDFRWFQSLEGPHQSTVSEVKTKYFQHINPCAEHRKGKSAAVVWSRLLRSWGWVRRTAVLTTQQVPILHSK